MSDTITIPASTVIPCDDRCMFAKGDDCDCECGGRNHQKGAMLTSLQRTVLRTRAGRRIPLLTPGTADWSLAFQMLEDRDEGMTNRDIAAFYGVSAPTVRRLIKSLLFTIETAEAQEEARSAA